MAKEVISRRQALKGIGLLALGGLVGCSNNQPIAYPPSKEVEGLIIKPREGVRPILVYSNLSKDRPATIAAYRFQNNHRDTIIAGRLTHSNAADTLRVAERRIESVWGGDGLVEPISSRHPGINDAPVWVVTPKKQPRLSLVTSNYVTTWFNALRETAAQLHLSDHRLPTHSLHLVLYRDAITERHRGSLRLLPELSLEAAKIAQLGGWPANMITIQFRLRKRDSLDHLVLKPVFKGYESWALYPTGLESQIL